jgi:hypothetical protein
MHTPAEGDDFAIELADGTLIESYIFETADDSILLDATPEIVAVLESWNLLSDQESEDTVILETMGHGTLGGEEDVDENTNPVLSNLTPDQIKGVSMMLKAGHVLPDIIRIFDNKITQQQIVAIANMNAGVAEGAGEQWMIYQDFGRGELVPYPHLPNRPFNTKQQAIRWISTVDPDWRNSNIRIDTIEPGRLGQPDVAEAKYHGREVPLGKPMKGDVKKSKVYVRDPATGNIKKVNFGDPNMRIKKTSPAHRKSFRARHHCENPGSRLKARYWSCRAW